MQYYIKSYLLKFNLAFYKCNSKLLMLKYYLRHTFKHYINSYVNLGSLCIEAYIVEIKYYFKYLEVSFEIFVFVAFRVASMNPIDRRSMGRCRRTID